MLYGQKLKIVSNGKLNWAPVLQASTGQCFWVCRDQEEGAEEGVGRRGGQVQKTTTPEDGHRGSMWTILTPLQREALSSSHLPGLAADHLLLSASVPHLLNQRVRLGRPLQPYSAVAEASPWVMLFVSRDEQGHRRTQGAGAAPGKPGPGRRCDLTLAGGPKRDPRKVHQEKLESGACLATISLTKRTGL